MDCDGDVDTSYIRVLPDTCVELFLNYTSAPVAIIGDELHQRSIATFRMNRPMDVRMRKGAGVVAICFHPGMAYKFIELPMFCLSNRTIALADVWNGMADEMEDKMAGSLTNEERIGIIQNYLCQKLRCNQDDPQIVYCLNEARLSGGLTSVDRLAHITGLSQRQLSRKFQKYVGLSPKEYLRISRFITSLTHLKRSPATSLTEVACETGYYDQSHFIRDYKDYTGFTPGQLLRSKHIFY